MVQNFRSAVTLMLDGLNGTSWGFIGCLHPPSFALGWATEIQIMKKKQRGKKSKRALGSYYRGGWKVLFANLSVSLSLLKFLFLAHFH